MNPPRKTTGLFLTPRGPYGRRLPERARRHMHASDTVPQDPDKKPQLSPQEMQGLTGQMTPNDAKGWKGPDRDDRNARMWDVPHLDDRGRPLPGPQPSYEENGPLINQPSYGHYDLPSENNDYRFGGEAAVSKAKGEAVDWDATLYRRSNSKFEDRRDVEDPLVTTRKNYQEEVAKRQDADKRQTFMYPRYQRPQTQQTSPQPQPFPISDTFTPRIRKTAPTDATLRPSPKWFSQGGEAPATLRSSPPDSVWPPDFKETRK